MPYSNPVIETCWILGTAVDVYLCVIILSRRLHRRWLSILVYSFLSLAFDVVIRTAPADSWTSYYAYWIWIGLAGLLRIWVLGDVVESFPGAALISDRVRLATFAAATVMAIGAWRIASLDLRAHHSTFRSTAALIDGAVAYAWGAFLVVFLVSIWVQRVRWSLRGGMITGGVSVIVCGDLVAKWMIATASRPQRHVAITLASLTALTAIIIWALALSLKEAFYQRSPNQSSKRVKVEPSCTL